jgi:ankyrin repeat protein
MSIQPKIDQLIEKLLSSIPNLASEIDDGDFNLECIGTHGRTPLMVASGEGLTDAFEILLARGAFVSTTGNGLLTALHEASANGHTQIAMRLIERGASVDAETIDKATPLMCAAAWGQLDMVRILLGYGADPTKVDSTGATAADIAREKGEDEIAEILEEEMLRFPRNRKEGTF